MGGRTPKSVLLQKIISAVLLELLKKKNLLIWKRNEKIVPGVCDAAFALYLLKIVFLFEFQNKWKIDGN